MGRVSMPEVDQWMEECVERKNESANAAARWQRAAGAWARRDAMHVGRVAISATGATTAYGSPARARERARQTALATAVGEVIAAGVSTAICERASSRLTFAHQTLPEAKGAATEIGRLLALLLLTGVESGGREGTARAEPARQGTSLFDVLARYLDTTDANELHGALASLLAGTVASQIAGLADESNVVPGKPSATDRVIGDLFERARLDLLAAICSGGLGIAVGFWKAAEKAREAIADHAGRQAGDVVRGRPYGTPYLRERPASADTSVYSAAYHAAEAEVWERTQKGLRLVHQAVDQASSIASSFAFDAFLPAIKETACLGRLRK